MTFNNINHDKYSSIHIHLHQKCIVLHKKFSNPELEIEDYHNDLYDYTKYKMLLTDLHNYISNNEVGFVREFLKDNNEIVAKLESEVNSSGQISLF